MSWLNRFQSPTDLQRLIICGIAPETFWIDVIWHRMSHKITSFVKISEIDAFSSVLQV
jgi:hypothetical protein